MNISARTQNQGSGRILSRILVSIDCFGLPISVYYKNKSAYRTVGGGIMSLIAGIIAIAYFSWQVSKVINFDNQTRKSSFIRNLATDKTSYELNSSNFDIAISFSFMNPMYNLETLDQYISINFIQLELDTNSDGIRELKSTSLGMGRCTSDRFMNDSEIHSQFSISTNYLCPIQRSMSVKSTFSSNSSAQISLILQYCSQSELDLKYPEKNVKCKSDEEIHTFFKFVSFNILLSNQYFDVNDYSKDYIKSYAFSYGGFFNSYIHQYKTFGISQNNAVDKRHWSGLGRYDDTQNYITVQMIHNLEAENGFILFPRRLVTFQLVLDQKVETMERVRFNIADAFSNTGGIVGLVFTACKMLSMVFKRKYLISDLIYDNLCFEKGEKTDQHKRPNNQINDESSRRDGAQLNVSPEPARDLEVDERNSQQRQVDAYWKKIKEMSSGVQLYFGLFDLLKNAFCLSHRHNRFEKQSKALQYKAGKKIIEDELDLRNIIRTKRFFQVLTKITFRKRHRYLITDKYKGYVDKDRVKQVILGQHDQDPSLENLDEQQVKQVITQCVRQNHQRVDKVILEQILSKDEIDSLRNPLEVSNFMMEAEMRQNVRGLAPNLLGLPGQNTSNLGLSMTSQNKSKKRKRKSSNLPSSARKMVNENKTSRGKEDDLE